MRSLREKLFALTMSLSLIPLVGISVFSYFIGSKQITEDRIKLSLEKMAQDTSDKIDLVLGEQREEVHSMATTFSLFYTVVSERNRLGMTRLLNNYCFDHEVYDVVLIADPKGKIVAINNMDRLGTSFSAETTSAVIGKDLAEFGVERSLFDHSIKGHSSQCDWYQSSIVTTLYDYEQQDRGHQFNVAYSEPVRNPETMEIVGVWISIVNWVYFQNILDSVEADLRELDLRTGYGFMFGKDANTIIAHKYRANRGYPEDVPFLEDDGQDLYQSKLIEDHGLTSLHNAILAGESSLAYDFPAGNAKMSGLHPIEDSFGWIVGVGIDAEDIFKPIENMKWWLIAVTLLTACLVSVFTYAIAQGITVPLNNLIRTARTIAQGNLRERVRIRTSDEVGILGSTFNDMARSLSEREQQLQVLNKNLEQMVGVRTRELEESHDALKKAYLELQSTQDQLVQSEKMASLGQLVAGIAHEIKNPLNFIYGNTGFLADYSRKLQSLVEAFDSLPSLSTEDKARLDGMKERANYDFIREDLATLIDNFTEGAERINTIVSDLRTFSRMDADALTDIDLHASLDMSLNLLRNQYKNRIEVHRNYGTIPPIQGYSGKLGQVFMNLLLNAFQAIEGNGEVWIRTRSANGTVEIEIEDSGSGIQKESLKRIFEPFFTTKPVGHGTGLGLSISYGIIEQHQGQIHVNSTAEKGSVFTVQLPVVQEGPAK